MSSKLLLDQPADRSLEAYQLWVREMAAAFGGADDMTPEEWQADWQEFWGTDGAA